MFRNSGYKVLALLPLILWQNVTSSNLRPSKDKEGQLLLKSFILLSKKQKLISMKNVLFFLVFSLFALSACNSETSTTEETNATAEATEVSEPTNNSVEIPSTLDDLFNPNASIFRGLNFGMSADQVKAAEGGEFVSEEEGMQVYSVDLNEITFADIEYKYAEGALNRIRVDIFADNPTQAQSLGDDITALFNEKYLARETLWDAREGAMDYTAFMEVIADEDTPGVVIIYELL